jgi:hypothetical protein
VDVQICWICGEIAKSGEHKTKRTDLRDVFEKPTQSSPLFLNSARFKNRRVPSFDSGLIKSPSLICENCNNNRTQPYDRAWELLSSWLRTMHQHSKAGTIVRADRMFTYDTARKMRNVHLFFVKLFGCHIKEGNIAIDLSKFSSAILAGKAHSNVYLKFGRGPTMQHGKAVSMSDVSTINANERCIFATWFYYVDWLAVMVMFAADGQKREGLKGAWHPRFGTNKLILSDFE